MDRATAALLLALCRAELPETERARIAGLLDQPVDWSQLANLAGLHGVVALVRHNLLVLHAHERVPFDPWEHIQQAAAQISFDAMLQLRTLGRIVAALQAAGIVPIVLKGYALASLLYADPMLRPAADIDLLVQRIEVERAWAMLGAWLACAISPCSTSVSSCADCPPRASSCMVKPPAVPSPGMGGGGKIRMLAPGI